MPRRRGWPRLRLSGADRRLPADVLERFALLLLSKRTAGRVAPVHKPEQTQEEDDPLPLDHLSIPGHPREEQRHGHHQWILSLKQLPVHSEGAQDRHDAEDQSQVGDVAADDVADCQFGRAAALKIGHHADDQFRQARAKRHNGQADNHQRNVEPHGKTAGAAHKKVGSAGQAGKADKKEKGIE